MKSLHFVSVKIAKLAALFSCGLFLLLTQITYAAIPEQRPLFLIPSVRPIVMLNMPKEQQLFYKLYTDYFDLTNASGGAPDTVLDGADLTYNNSYNYYGYFDSDKCYTYSSTNSRFEPSAWATSSGTEPTSTTPYAKNCTATNDWSGNFLNWASMTRMDAIRKILYGGYRSTDTAKSVSADGEVVLERAFLPNDAHSFAKFYLPSSNAVTELQKVVPDELSDASGLTLCNTTDSADRSAPGSAAALSLSQNVTSPPLIKAAKGNYSLWAANERWQCRYRDVGFNPTNANNSANSGISASANSPRPGGYVDNANHANDVPAAYTNYVARVQVCKSGLIAAPAYDNEKCKEYSTGNVRPVGLLQKYGEADLVRFGLVTGTYSLNKQGGVLRKAVGTFANEVEAATGRFLNPTYSIIRTLNSLRIYGYRYDDGTYHGVAWSDNCIWNINAFNNGKCTNWGNPQAEIYLESLRYLAGLGAPTAAYNGDDSGLLSGLTKVPDTNTTAGTDWADPIDFSDSGNYCAPLNVLQFNASITSFDDDGINLTPSPFSAAATGTLDSYTNTVGIGEALAGDYFMGSNGTGALTNGFCTAKTIGNLSDVSGVCPEAPRLQGSYNLAGLAYMARKYGLKEPSASTRTRQKVMTYGVALAAAQPKVDLAIPGTNPTKYVTIIPACRNQNSSSNCAIVDFKVIPDTALTTSTTTVGKLYVNWEDSEQGGDFDQDMWGTLEYSVTNAQLTITSNVFAQSASGVKMGFGYVLAGTADSDGLHIAAGANGFDERLECLTLALNCDVNQAHTDTYALGVPAAAVAKSLQLPLYYAAKWGGWADVKNSSGVTAQPTDAQIAATDPLNHTSGGTYYYAIDPKSLENDINRAVEQMANIVGSASTVAANSTNLQTDTQLFQARFDSTNWTGQMLAYGLNRDGTLGTVLWNTDNTLTRPTPAVSQSGGVPSGRNVYTSNGTSTTAIALTAPTDAADLRDALKLSSESTYTNADARFYWLLGSSFNEGAGVGKGLRVRTKVMGDIVNSDPAYAGAASLRLDKLPTGTSSYGASSYLAYVVAKASRTPAVFVGANDGMLHAFNASTSGSDMGKEIFAYIPRGVYSKLANLSSPAYTHSYAVDGPIYVNDVYINGAWRTLVSGTLGAGGRGAYSLDVTDVLAGTSTAPKVVFDVSADDSLTPTSLKNDLGYSYSKVVIVPTVNGKWTAFFGNGVESNNGYAKLIAVDINSSASNTNLAASGSYVAIDTKAKMSSTQNGLAGMALLPDTNGIITYAYAGDIMGNMWKFEMTNNNSSNWKVAYGSGSSPDPLIRVIDTNGAGQPITTAPVLGNNAKKSATATMVYFGTGKYNEVADVSDTQRQSIYGIVDEGNAITLTVANRTTTLHQKSITAEASGVRTISGDTNTATSTAVDWTNSAIKGWFLDLVNPTTPSLRGERVIAKPLLIYDRLISYTFIPSSNPCAFGGEGWIMDLGGVGDLYGAYKMLNSHKLDYPIVSEPLPIGAGEYTLIAGSQLGDITHDSTITTEKVANPAGSSGRMSWRQLK